MRSVSAALSSLNATWAAIRDQQIICLRRPMFSSNKTFHWNSLPVFLCLYSLCSSSSLPTRSVTSTTHSTLVAGVKSTQNLKKKQKKRPLSALKRGSSLWGADSTSRISVCVRRSDHAHTVEDDRVEGSLLLTPGSVWWGRGGKMQMWNISLSRCLPLQSDPLQCSGWTAPRWEPIPAEGRRKRGTLNCTLYVTQHRISSLSNTQISSEVLNKNQTDIRWKWRGGAIVFPEISMSVSSAWRASAMSLCQVAVMRWWKTGGGEQRAAVSRWRLHFNVCTKNKKKDEWVTVEGLEIRFKCTRSS